MLWVNPFQEVNQAMGELLSRAVARSFYFGAIRVPVPNPIDKPNRCKLREETQKRPWKPLYLVFFG